MLFRCAACLLTACILLSASSACAVEKKAKQVILQGLNKITAHVSELKGAVGEEMHFGKLTVVAKSCWTAPKSRRPEHAALLEVTEYKNRDMPEKIFSGWMFASSPALSALEHPVYDLKVLRCH